MYSAPEQRTSYSRVAAAALLAVSAGACVGVALSPAVSSLYAPVAVQPAVSSQAATILPHAAMPVQSGVYTAEQWTGASEVAAPAQHSSVNAMSLLAGGAFAAAAALFAMAFKGSSQKSEQIAMLAASGKKAAAKSSGERLLWYPTAEAPEWLDGSLPGDRGFDPWGLSKPTEYLQFDLDGLDQNNAKNPAGRIVGAVKGEADQLTGDAFVPYSEVFGLQRFRENEVIHGRWAMLAVLGCLVSEAVTGVAWQNAGLVEAQAGASYWGFALPFSGTQLVWFEVLTMGFVEIFRNTELNPERRVYPGGAFDPLGLASKDDETTFRLKEAEIKHGRLAMISFLGFAAAAGNTGLGATQSFNSFAQSFF